uniref:Phosphoenolpyruvate-protein phosphotransferase n=1 Tax=Thermofilum pendens TaxID=2269 RepID=A0A7C3SK93_THEPE
MPRLVFKGLVVSQGVVEGTLLVIRRADLLGHLPGGEPEDVEAEASRLRKACRVLRERLEELAGILPESERGVVEAQLLMLDSLASEAEELVRGERVRAEHAVKRVYEKYAELLESGGELFALRAQDLRDLARRLVSQLLEDSTAVPDYRGRVVVAEELDPIEFMEAFSLGALGAVTRTGGLTSHVSILARLRGIPYMISKDLDVSLLRDGDWAILDCVSGQLLVEPSEAERERYRALAAELEELVRLYTREAHLDPLTADGVRVEVVCNAGSIEDIRAAPDYGCGGVGLFRIEFAYMVRGEAPVEEELYEILRRGLGLLTGKPLTVRAPDIGGDKPVGFLELPREPNPQLGVRGTRLLLKHKEKLLRPFVRASLRAAVEGDLRLMFPMVSSVEEVEELVGFVKEEAESMEAEGVAVRLPKLGVMVEVPSAAILVRELVERGGLSFISFGTNDLTQYVLAADRGSPYVSHIYDELSPAVLRLVKYAAERVRGRAEIEVCGEMASRGLAVPLLVGLGVNALSVAPAFVGRVKYVIRRVRWEELSREVPRLVEQASTSREIREWIQSYLSSTGVKVFD